MKKITSGLWPFLLMQGVAAQQLKIYHIGDLEFDPDISVGTAYDRGDMSLSLLIQFGNFRYFVGGDIEELHPFISQSKSDVHDQAAGRLSGWCARHRYREDHARSRRSR